MTSPFEYTSLAPIATDKRSAITATTTATTATISRIVDHLLEDYTPSQSRCILKAIKAVTVYNNLYPDRPYVNPIQFTFDLRGGVAGRAFTGLNLIKINQYHLDNNEDDMVNDTVLHEVGHLLAYHRYGRRIQPHGAEWSEMCVLIGLRNPSTYHTYKSIPARYEATVTYTCACAKQHKVGLVTHKRMQKGDTRICTTCGQRLVRQKPKVNKLAQMALAAQEASK